MKSKRLLSLILVLCLVIPGFTATAEFKDVPSGVAYYEAVNLLSTLKIIQGYPDGTFGPENDVTRAEFTTLLIRAMNLETLAQAADLSNFPFTDCTSAGIAYALPNIKLAYERGIILGMGDKIFAPEEKVTYEQAVKMVVCAAGYEVVANENGGWPNGYLAAAQKIRLLDDVNGQVGVPAKRWQIAQLIYNAFPVELMTKTITGDSQEPVYTVNQDKTWLSEYLGLKKDTGTFVADSVTSIGSSGIAPRDGECLIALDSNRQETLFKIGTASINGLIGKSVIVYYKENRANQEKTIMFLGDNSKVGASKIIDAEDLIGFKDLNPFNGGRIEYFENKGTSNEKKVYLNVAPNPTFVLNGKLYTPRSKAEFEEEMGSLITGKVEFIDSTSTGSYDKVFVTKTETYVVSKNTLDTVTNSARIITDLYRNTSQRNTYTIDQNDGESVVTLKNQNGANINATDIGTWNVLEIQESKNDSGRTLINITVVNKPISGTISEVSTDGEVEIGGKAYKLSSYYQKYAIGNNKENGLTLGQTGTFYLDSSGKIAAVSVQNVVANYGYIYNMGMKDGELSTDEFIIQMRRSNNTLAQYSITSRITYDGVSKTPADGYSYLKSTAKLTNYDTAEDMIGRDDFGSPQLIKYTLDSSGRIKTIVTVNQPGTKISATNLTRANIGYEENENGSKKALAYKTETSTSGHFIGTDGTKVQVNANTILFMVGKTRSESTVRIGSVRNDLADGEPRVIEAFDVDASLAKVLIVYSDNTLEKMTSATPLSIVTDMRDGLNPTTESSATRFDAFQVSSSFTGLKSNIWADNTSALSGVRLGDVIKTVTDENGNVRSGDGVVKVWDVNASQAPSADDNPWVNKQPIKTGSYYYQTLVGYIYSINDDKTRITIAVTTDPSEIETAEKVAYDVTSFGGYLVFNGNLEKPVLPSYTKDAAPNKLTFDDVYPFVQTYDTNPSNPTEVLIHLTGGTSTGLVPRLLYVILRK